TTQFLDGPGDIGKNEKWWVERQEALERAGYLLRPRYRPGWEPSWTSTKKSYLDFEDGKTLRHPNNMDATRTSDGRQVMLKRLPFRAGPYELEINNLFSTEPLSSNPRNHCVQTLDVIRLPNDPPIIVQPLLRPFYNPPFQTFGEFVTSFAQICDGVHFMHENHVAHRDCTLWNIMLDPSHMYPESFHLAVIEKSKDFRRKAKWYSRTRRPTRYLLIDFGLSRRYDPANGPPLEKPVHGGDKTVPEHRDLNTPCNPFPTDVYYLGNMIREDYMQKYKEFEFMESLVTDMVQEDPTKRPSMEEVVTRFSEIRGKLSTWKLRSRIARRDELWPVTVWKSIHHWYCTIGYVLGRKAAIPEPK
ncbi:kinase-like domain-containing protein, partial [Russula dissimulans]